jgi:hypothetical protein
MLIVSIIITSIGKIVEIIANFFSKADYERMYKALGGGYQF